MSKRLDQDRQFELEPDRFEFAKSALQSFGYVLTLYPPKRIEFFHDGYKVTLYPYSGWHTGRSIIDGRGIHNLVKQLK